MRRASMSTAPPSPGITTAPFATWESTHDGEPDPARGAEVLARYRLGLVAGEPGVAPQAAVRSGGLE